MSKLTSSKITVGIDIVSISRIRQLMKDYPESSRNLFFSKKEQDYCSEQVFPYQHYAARWAVKEAFIKAVRDSKPNPDLTSIEIIGGTPPRISLSNDGFDILMDAASSRDSSPENTDIAFSMTHEQDADLALGLIIILF
jgi:holo-[acyl-carrier protein] synthase